MLLDVVGQRKLPAVSQTSVVSLLLPTKAERGEEEKQHVCFFILQQHWMLSQLKTTVWGLGRWLRVFAV